MGKRKLSQELKTYGYVFTFKKTMASFFGMLFLALCLGFLFHLQIQYLILVCLIASLLLPLFIRNYYYNKYEQEAFSDVNIYMEQFMYSFMKTGKIYSTLQEVSGLFDKGRMKKTIHTAIDMIRHANASLDPEGDALGYIESEYAYDGLNSLHKFCQQVEKNGGAYGDCMQLLIESRRMWADRNYELMKLRKQQRMRVIISIVSSLLLCELIAYMATSINVDVSSNIYVQLVTSMVLILDMFIYYRADRKLSASLLSEDAVDEKESLATYLRYKKYMKNPGRHRLAIKTAKKRLVRDYQKVFPKWLMEVSLLLQCENTQVAIFKSYDDAPELLKEDLKKFIVDIKREPNSMKAYNNFLQDFDLPEVRSAMKMLYSLSEGSGGNAASQIEDIIRRNQILMDRAMKLKREDDSAGMYALFLAPQLTGAAKLMVDMVFMFVMYIATMVG